VYREKKRGRESDRVIGTLGEREGWEDNEKSEME